MRNQKEHQKDQKDPEPSHGGGRRTARERMHERRTREKAAERRIRAWKAGAVVVAVLAVIGLVGVLLAGREDEAEAVARPVVLGKAKAPSTLTVYEDFRCPACAHFERTFEETIDTLRRQGALRTEYHLVTLIDGNLGGRGSRYAANAALCARDEGRFAEYHEVLFAHQPEESGDRFGDHDRLIELAGKVEGLDTASFRECVRSSSHEKRVQRSDAAFSASGHLATPTVLLDGENVYGGRERPLTPEELKRKVEAAAKGR